MASKGDIEELRSMSKASIEVKVKEEAGKKIDRHCAFCLTLVKGEEVKTCSKCKRRAYCSKECQAADWIKPKDEPALIGKVYGYGQGHKDWCGLPYGEEDLDWKVAPISGKGLGLVAVRDLPYLYRIIVEGIQPLPTPLAVALNQVHPGINDLVSCHGQGDIYKKFNDNFVTTSSGKAILGLRISRANHRCAGNASYTIDKALSVLILYSNREIKKGEEICYPYCDGPPEEDRKTLFEKWGITCPPSCVCRDEEICKMMETCRELVDECERECKGKDVLHKMEKAVEIAEKCGCSASVSSTLLSRAADYAIASSVTFGQARGLMERSFRINQAIYHPRNFEMKQKQQQEKGRKKIDRHCGFCLTLVKGEEVVLCEGCKRRAYCSKECQKADWESTPIMPAFNGKIFGYVQGHKDWCKVEYGEEDLDWKVVPIEGKGLGIVALRDFPPLYRILTEGIQTLPKPMALNMGLYRLHPGVDDLVPSLPKEHRQGIDVYDNLKKFSDNSLTTSFGPSVGLRLSRANHSCDANASYAVDETLSVLILYSNREIKKGEEICISYRPFNDVFTILTELFWGMTPDGDYEGRDPESVREILCKKWGIVCPPSCPCREEANFEMLKTCVKIDEECKKDFRKKNVLPLFQKILEVAGPSQLGCAPAVMSKLYWRGSEYAIAREETFEQAKAFMEKSFSFNQAVYHPRNWAQLQVVEVKIKHLSKCPGYC